MDGLLRPIEVQYQIYGGLLNSQDAASLALAQPWMPPKLPID